MLKKKAFDSFDRETLALECVKKIGASGIFSIFKLFTILGFPRIHLGAYNAEICIIGTNFKPYLSL